MPGVNKIYVKKGYDCDCKFNISEGGEHCHGTCTLRTPGEALGGGWGRVGGWGLSHRRQGGN